MQIMRLTHFVIIMKINVSAHRFPIDQADDEPFIHYTRLMHFAHAHLVLCLDISEITASARNWIQSSPPLFAGRWCRPSALVQADVMTAKHSAKYIVPNNNTERDRGMSTPHFDIWRARLFCGCATHTQTARAAPAIWCNLWTRPVKLNSVSPKIPDNCAFHCL